MPTTTTSSDTFEIWRDPVARAAFASARDAMVSDLPRAEDSALLERTAVSLTGSARMRWKIASIGRTAQG